MKTTVTVATFNLENLFGRYAFLDMPWENRDYEQIVMAVGVASVASRTGDLVSYETTDIQRNNTALAVLETQPDMLAVQEVENIEALRIFNAEYLDHYFNRILLIDGNDPRGIDVGILLRDGFAGEILSVRTHVDEARPNSKVRRESRRNWGYFVDGAVFSRDCLEVDVRVGQKTLTLLVNHLKAQDGKPASVQRRKKQADRVAEIADQNVKAGRLPIVLGDLNVPPGRDDSLDALLKCPDLVDPLPADEWTHYYESKREVSRLDYILPHKSLKVLDYKIVRSGLTTKCKRHAGARYPTIGPAHTEASDHCPVSLRIEV
jgi:endonuclease/exonuclease/phosphatase family metal-dependent hydrolase